LRANSFDLHFLTPSAEVDLLFSKPLESCTLGVADWHGREEIRENLRAFADKGFTAHQDVLEYRHGGALKIFAASLP
jgi:hypothetical protein